VVTGLPATLATAGVVFAGTNLDDLLVLTLLFLSARAAGRPATWQIWVGQYAGFAVLVAISAAAATGLVFVPQRWVGLLAVIPCTLGVVKLVALLRTPERGVTEPAAAATGVASVALVTIANGGDNIAAYTPLWRALDIGASTLTIAVFAVLLAVWITAAAWLAAHKRIVVAVERSGSWLVPVAYLFIAALIVAKSGLLAQL